jgi:RND family efflux transporter MFP subunit
MKSFERVTAPFDGVITARNVDAGALINAGSSASPNDPTATVTHSGILGIARTDVLRIQVSVPQIYTKLIQSGQSAGVSVREFPGKVFSSRVFRVAGALDAASRTQMVELRLNNSANMLVPGMYATVRFGIRQSGGQWRVPANTLIIDASGTRVASVTESNTIRFVPVKLGRDFGKEVEITEGISGSERLVADPTDDLTEGSVVAPTIQSAR